MEALARHLRRQLENVVVTARETAETAARAALMHLGVGEADPPRHLTEPERALRRRLRAHGRQLGDHLRPDGRQGIDRLVQETAYEHWHRMLFARFLAENGLLMHPDGVAVSLAECSELAPDEGAANGWELAGRYASRMLPQIFRPDSPVLALSLAPEHQRALEHLLADLPPETFEAGDSLGWVYQFWQTKKKDEVNASEVKIGADELPAVTQLFTEPYMVAFLLDNSLGAWWAARRLSEQDLRSAQTEDDLRRKAAIPGVPLEYLRFVRTPATSDSACVARASSPGASGQDGLTTQVTMDERTLVKSHGEHLPHWSCKGAVYHVVYRLADSAPQAKLDLWAAERRSIEEQAKKDLDPKAEEALRQARLRHSEEVDAYLDTGHGACHLEKPEIAEIIANALKHFDSDRYRLHAWCVMPNHVHGIVEPLGDNPLSEILHRWKSFTANAINRRLGLSGTLWQADAYNHIIRTQKEYDYQVAYVWHNPDKASIPNWPWRWAADYAVIDPDCACVARASSPDQSGQDGLTTHPDCAARSFGPDQSGQDGLTTQAPWTPAAGTFDGWPERLADLKVMDPCCGSGHFLVAGLEMLVPMRMELEGLTARDAVDAVLRENLHGLELDRRCIEIAAFALALAAWRWPGAGGWRPLPTLNLACSGLGIHASKADWLRLGEGDPDLEHALERLYELFKDAPTLGSLIDPRRALGDDLLNEGWERVAPLMARALASGNEEARELGVVAQGLAHAAELLAGRYHWVMTNVPYLARTKHSSVLKRYCDSHYFAGRNDLATCFVARC